MFVILSLVQQIFIEWLLHVKRCVKCRLFVCDFIKVSWEVAHIALLSIVLSLHLIINESGWMPQRIGYWALGIWRSQGRVAQRALHALILTMTEMVHSQEQLFLKGTSFVSSVRKVKAQNNLRFVKCSTKGLFINYVWTKKTNQVRLGYISWQRYVMLTDYKKRLIPNYSPSFSSI